MPRPGDVPVDSRIDQGEIDILKVPEGLPNSSHGREPVVRVILTRRDPGGVSHSLYLKQVLVIELNACFN